MLQLEELGIKALFYTNIWTFSGRSSAPKISRKLRGANKRHRISEINDESIIEQAIEGDPTTSRCSHDLSEGVKLIAKKKRSRI